LLVESSRAYGRGVLRGIAAFARAAGNWSIFHQEQVLAVDAPAWLRGWRGDGMIARVESRKLARRLSRARLPAVDLIGRYPMPGVPIVESDDRAVIRLAIDHLRDQGFRHLAFCGYAQVRYSDRRRHFFEEELGATPEGASFYNERIASRYAERTTMSAEVDGAKHYGRLARWLRGLPKPVGIVACNDIRALQVLHACREYEIAVPDDVAVIGIDNDDVLCELARPTLTSVEQDTHRIGYEAAALLHRMMTLQRPLELPRSAPPVRVVVRASTDVLALDDRVVAAALRFIRRHACDGIGVAEVVRHVGLSRASLERRMRQRLGRSPLSEIHRVRLDRVKQLLVETDYALPEIARLTGFTYSEYMIAFFQRFTETTPHAYRKSSRERSMNHMF
jgi:LacI family transcriptional regulator